MSIRAANWALNQLTDGPSAQAVLFTIADAANEHGICRHADPDYIAQKSRQSRATVFRRLEELERVGLLSRFVRHLENGSRRYEIRLCLDVAVNYQVDRTRTVRLFSLEDLRCEGEPIRVLPFSGEGSLDPSSEASTEPENLPPDEEVPATDQYQIETHPVAPMRLAESHSCDSQESLLKNPSKNPSPQSPPEPANDAGPPYDPTFETSWIEFKKGYPIEIVDIRRTRSLIAALSADERERLVHAARGYRRFVEGQRRRALDAHRFIANGTWEGFVDSGKALAPPRSAAAASSDRVWIAPGSAEFEAFELCHKIAGRAPLPTAGVWIPGPLPKGAAALSALTRRNAAGQIDLTGWVIWQDGTPQFAAWSGRVEEWLGRAAAGDAILARRCRQGSAERRACGQEIDRRLPMAELDRWNFGAGDRDRLPAAEGSRRGCTGPGAGRNGLGAN